MKYFCSVHLQSKKDEERTIFIVLDENTENPMLTKQILLANSQYQAFMQKYRPKLVLAEYTVYATEEKVYASSQDEVFEALISDGKANKVGQSEITIDCVKDKVSRKKKKKKISPVMAASICGDIQTEDHRWTDENGMIIPEQNAISEDAEQITISIDRSYSAVPTEDLQLKGEVVDGVAYITLPEFDKTDFFTHVPGYTWGFTSNPDGDQIEYYVENAGRSCS